MMRLLVGAILALVLSSGAEAATCYWVGGTATWNGSNTTSWASASGGTGGTCAASGGIPTTGDTANFDGSSGGGTVTVNTTINVATISIAGFTGTLDFSANNNNVNLSGSFLCGTSGTRTLNLGNGTWTFSLTSGTPWSCATTTSLTLNGNSSSLVFSGTSTGTRTISLGAISSGTGYNNVTISNASSNAFLIDLANAGNWSIGGALTFTNLRNVRLSGGASHTVTGTFAFDGATNAPALFYTNGTAATLSVAATNTWTWIVPQNITVSGAGTITCTNCYNGGGSTGSGLTITNPSSGGKIIGG